MAQTHVGFARSHAEGVSVRVAVFMAMKENARLILFAASLSMAACSSSLPEVKPGKIHKRYFPYTNNIFAYSLTPPIGPWRYIEPKYEAIGDISFIGQAGPHVFVDVSFGMSELLVKFNDADVIEANKKFFKTGKLSDTPTKDPVVTITVGAQGVRCVNSGFAWQQHFGPDRDPKISGKWAGQGNTRISYQIMCPFHMDGRHYWFVMDKSYVVPDALTADGQEVDVKAMNDEVDRQFENVWKSIVFNPALSQAPLPQ